MLEFFKSICNLHDLYVIWFILSLVWLFFIYRKKDVAYSSSSLKAWLSCLPATYQMNLLFGLLFYLICATSYVPKKLIYKKENTFAVFNPSQLDTTKTYYIHVLGSGYSLDERLFPTQQLSKSSLARLTEAIRIYHQAPNIKIVTSAYSKYGMESQASITRKAATELKVDPNDLYMLEEPSTTSEEVQAFVSRFGTEVSLIVSSDALHLPRAIQMYRNKGINALAAPTNFKAKVDVNNPIRFSFPKSRSFRLANDYFNTVSKEWYYALTGK